MAHFILRSASALPLAHLGDMRLPRMRKRVKLVPFKSDPIEFIADDIVLTPKHVYCVGHYRRVGACS